MPPLPNSFVYTSLDQFKVLDHFVDQRFTVMNYRSGAKKFIWVNEGLIRYTQSSYEFWMNFDMNSGQSQAMDEFQEEVYQKVQVGREVHSQVKTTHAQGIARTLLMTHWPIQVKLPEMEQEMTLCICEAKDIENEHEWNEGGVQKTATEEQRAEREKMLLAHELLQHSETTSMMFDQETKRIEYKNQQTVQLYENPSWFSQQRTQGSERIAAAKMKTLDDVFACVVWDGDEEREETIKAIDALQLDSARLQLDFQMVFPGRSGECWHSLHFIPARNPITSKPAIIVHQTDVTKLHLQSQQLLEASQQQEAFTSAVSHELRTPLNGIIGLSESLINNPDCTEKMLKTLRLVKSSGLRLAALVNDILDAASARRGKFVIKREMVLFGEVAENVCEMLQTVVPPQVKLKNTVDQEPLPHIEGDSNRLNQILTNLLANAIKFTTKGHIIVKARMLSTEEVLVEVTDTGCGIAEEAWQQIWRPFKQVDMTTTRKYGGTGLGLSLVKELVEAHNGRVGVTSKSTGSRTGSSFFFVLPVRQPHTDSPPSASEVLRIEEVVPGVLVGGAEAVLPRASGDTPRRLGALPSPARSESEGAGHSFNSAFSARSTPAVGDGSTDSGGLASSIGASKRSGRETWAADLAVNTRTPTLSMSGSFQSKTQDDGEDAEAAAVATSFDQPAAQRLQHHSELHGSFEILSEQLSVHDNVTVMMVDLVDFRPLAKELSDSEVVGLVNGLYDRFDAIAKEHKLMRAVDDSFLFVLEDPDLPAQKQVFKMLEVAKKVMSAAAQVHTKVRTSEEPARVRLGLGQGTAASTLVGMRQTSYMFFGQAVRDAAQMAFRCPLGCVAVPQNVQATLADPDQILALLTPGPGRGEAAAGDHGGEGRPCVYLAKVGGWEQALLEADASGAEPNGWGQSERNVFKSILRLSSTGLDPEPRAGGWGWSSGNARGGGCGRCREWQQWYEASAEQCTCGAVTAVDIGLGRPAGTSFSQRSAVSMRRELPNLLLTAGGAVRDHARVHAEAVGCPSPHRLSPATTPSTEQDEVCTQVSVEGEKTIEVLSVDDDPVNQIVVENLLEPVGYTVHQAMDGLEALEFLKDCQRLPELVLLDVMMPNMGGYECCQEIRKQYSQRVLPVIMVSAKSSPEHVVAGLEAGATDFVAKPFNREEFLARVSTQLNMRQVKTAEVQNVHTTRLLERMMPAHVLERLARNETDILEEHADVTVLSCCVVGFGELAASLPHGTLHSILGRLLDAFSELALRFGCSVANIGVHRLLVVAGQDGDTGHAPRVTAMAVEMIHAVRELAVAHNGAGRRHNHLQIRLGVDTGQAQVAVLGTKQPCWRFLGDAVIAARAIEESCPPNNVQVSQRTAALLEEEGVEMEAVGACAVAGQGRVETHILKAEGCEWETGIAVRTQVETSSGDRQGAALAPRVPHASQVPTPEAQRGMARRLSAAVLLGAHGSFRHSRTSSDHTLPPAEPPHPPPPAALGLTREQVVDVVKDLLGSSDAPKASPLPQVASEPPVPQPCRDCAVKEARLAERASQIEALRGDHARLLQSWTALAQQVLDPPLAAVRVCLAQLHRALSCEAWQPLGACPGRERLQALRAVLWLWCEVGAVPAGRRAMEHRGAHAEGMRSKAAAGADGEEQVQAQGGDGDPHSGASHGSEASSHPPHARKHPEQEHARSWGPGAVAGGGAQLGDASVDNGEPTARSTGGFDEVRPGQYSAGYGGAGAFEEYGDYRGSGWGYTGRHPSEHQRSQLGWYDGGYGHGWGHGGGQGHGGYGGRRAERVLGGMFQSAQQNLLDSLVVACSHNPAAGGGVDSKGWETDPAQPMHAPPPHAHRLGWPTSGWPRAAGGEQAPWPSTPGAYSQGPRYGPP